VAEQSDQKIAAVAMEETVADYVYVISYGNISRSRYK